MNDGKPFEWLIHAIQKTVHRRATVQWNEALRDRDTGRSRQVDLTLRLTDGPTSFLAIIEVRDRSRPLGVNYVEEVNDKKRAVAADAAFLVSRSGFYKTALLKAEKLGIRTLTYEQAKANDWSGWIQARTFPIIEQRYANAMVTFYDRAGRMIPASEELVARLRADPKTGVLIPDGDAPFTAADIVQSVVTATSDALFNGLELNGAPVRRSSAVLGEMRPASRVEGADGQLHEVGGVGIEVDVCLAETKYPLELLRYRDTSRPESLAEVLAANVEVHGKPHRIELIVSGAGDFVPEGSTMRLRFTERQTESPKDE